MFIIAGIVAFLIVAIGFTVLDVVKAAGQQKPAPRTITPYTGPIYTRHGREFVRVGKAVL